MEKFFTSENVVFHLLLEHFGIVYIHLNKALALEFFHYSTRIDDGRIFAVPKILAQAFLINRALMDELLHRGNHAKDNP